MAAPAQTRKPLCKAAEAFACAPLQARAGRHRPLKARPSALCPPQMWTSTLAPASWWEVRGPEPCAGGVRASAVPAAAAGKALGHPIVLSSYLPPLTAPGVLRSAVVQPSATAACRAAQQAACPPVPTPTRVWYGRRPLAEFRNAPALLALPEAQQFQFLHQSVYVALDELVGRHKVRGGASCGRVMLASPVWAVRARSAQGSSRPIHDRFMRADSSQPLPLLPCAAPTGLQAVWLLLWIHAGHQRGGAGP